MAEEELELDLEEENKVEERIKKLSNKVKDTSKERDEFKAELEKEKAEKETLAKEAGFLKNFNALAGKYQGANEFQDKILEKFKAGYEPEDAIVSVLQKEGKLNPQPKVEEKEIVAGGSASTGLKGGAEKSPEEMSRDELRQALMQRELEGENILKKS